MQIPSELQYPIGRFVWSGVNTPTDRERMLQVLEQLPERYRAAVEGLNDEQLDTPYREGGWTLRQVVHHVADSHMQAYARVKLALTESNPVIKPYDEAAWAALPDSKLPIEVSLRLIAAVHLRWTTLMRSFTNAEWERSFRHPERGQMSLDMVLAMYNWHGEHHLAHLAITRQRNKW